MPFQRWLLLMHFAGFELADFIHLTLAKNGGHSSREKIDWAKGEIQRLRSQNPSLTRTEIL
jgi:hypothetical protein